MSTIPPALAEYSNAGFVGIRMLFTTVRLHFIMDRRISSHSSVVELDCMELEEPSWR